MALGEVEPAAETGRVAAHEVARRRRRRRHRHTVLTEHVRRYALSYCSFVQRIGEKGEVAVNVSINEARGDHLVGGIDAMASVGGRELADGGDAVAENADIGVVPRVAAAIDNPPALNQDVEHALSGCWASRPRLAYREP